MVKAEGETEDPGLKQRKVLGKQVKSSEGFHQPPAAFALSTQVFRLSAYSSP